MYGGMSLTTTGFHSARSIPEGARVTRAYWTVPGPYADLGSFDTEEAALEWALIEARRKGLDRVVTELRWKFAFPGGGGLEAPIQRNTYADIASAQEHLGRIRFYSEPVAG